MGYSMGAQEDSEVSKYVTVHSTLLGCTFIGATALFVCSVIVQLITLFTILVLPQ